MRIISLLLILLPLLATQSLAQTFYKWTDENGRKHYATTPPPTRQELEVITPGVGGSRKAGRAAKVLAVIDRKEGTLMEVKFEDNGEQLILHLSSVNVDISLDDLVEIVARGDDKDSTFFDIRRWPHHKGTEYLGSVPRPEQTK